MDTPKIILMGYSRHGKDSVALLTDAMFGIAGVSSSWWAAQHIVWPAIRDSNVPHTYATEVECFNDRHNHRQMWYELIKEYNEDDQTRMGRAIFANADMYIGVRSSAEFHALRNTGSFDYAVWVDASQRLPAEGRESCTVEPWMADFVIDNNGDEIQLERNVRQAFSRILQLGPRHTVT